MMTKPLAQTTRSILMVTGLLTAAPCGLIAQDSPRKEWWKEAEARLRDIYENGEYRARRFRAEWLADSSGYTVRQRNPETGNQVILQYDVVTGKSIEVNPSGTDRSVRENLLSPDGKQQLEIRDRSLFVRDLDRGRRTRLTSRVDGRDIWLRNPTWSPDSKRVLFVESDETEVRLRPVLVPVDPSYPRVQERRFARVGGKIAGLRVCVVDSEGTSVNWLPIDSPPEGFYLGQVQWAANSEEVLVEKLSRFRDQREFLLVNVSTGSVQQIFGESDPAWSVGSQGKNSGLDWIRDGDEFVVVSEKDGWRHAYRCSRDGKEQTLLTPGEYDIIDRTVIDEANGWFYFYASPDNGTQKHLHRVPLDGSGELERITPQDQPGTHTYDFSPDARWAFHTWSTFDRPPIVELVALPDHRIIRVLEDNSEVRAKVESLITSPTEFLQLNIGDGVTMDAWMIKPRHFDQSKKYPVLVYVYGEPYAQTVLDEWGAHHADFHRLIADLGYLVVSIDNRGTPAPKGAAWRRSIFGSLGPLSTEDQAKGLKELGRTRPYVDLDRVAIWGWSGGGSNTLNAMFRKPGMYHVGIAVVPKPQPHLYNAWFQEIYMRTREVNPDGYEKAAAMNFAEGLDGRLLIVTGSGETNTHIQIVEGLVDRLIELGKPFDYMVYPNRDHGLREGPGTAVHLRMLMARYLIEHLQPGPR